MAKWSRASGQSSEGDGVENCSIFQLFLLLCAVPFCEFLQIWSSFLSILFASKYLQPNFEVLDVLRSLITGLNSHCARA